MIDVVMTCYFPADVPERQQYALAAAFSLRKNLDYSSGLRLIVADDSEEVQQGTIDELTRIGSAYWENDALHTRSYHQGIGASLNTALEQVSNMWLYTTDDWELTGLLDLDGPSRLLAQGYDLVRLGPVHPDLQCVTRFQVGLGWWLDINQQYGGFAFATRPFLATKQFYEKVGPFDVKQNSYETERLYAERIARRADIKLAYWGGVDLSGPWQHLGLVEVGYREVV